MPILESNETAERYFNSDNEFNELYPSAIKQLATRHWTPLAVARTVSNFLAEEKHSRILDIGSGVGKFCLAGAFHQANSLFYGVEQRENLVGYADEARELLQLQNVRFIHGNFTELDFRDFDHFYFYNSFFENIASTDKIDESIDYSHSLFHYYNSYLYSQLEQMPVGTRLVTFHSFEDEVPECYREVYYDVVNFLRFRERV